MFIYLLYKNVITPLTGLRALTPRKETRRKERVSGESEEKRYRGTGGEPLTPTQAIGALTRDEEQVKKEKAKRKELSLRIPRRETGDSHPGRNHLNKGIDHLTRRRTQETGIVEGWEDK